MTAWLDLLRAPTAEHLAWLAGGLNFLAVLLAWYLLVEGRGRPRSLERIARTYAVETPRRSRVAQLRPDLVRLATLTLRSLDLLRVSGIEAWRLALVRAGLRSREALIVFVFAKLALPAAALLLLVPALFVETSTLTPTARLAFSVALCGGAFFLPDLAIGRRAAARRARIQKALPDALDLLVVCAEAGLALDAALQRVARELGRGAPELADELTVTSVELTFLPERRQALHNLAKRVPLSGITALTSTLVQTERYGTPLAMSLRVLAEELRERRLIRAEEKAARLPAVLTVPLIVFILPALFVVLGGPAVLDIMDYLSRR